VSGCCLTPGEKIFQLCHGVNKLNFVDDDDVDDALYQKNTFGALLVVIVWINNYLCNQLVPITTKVVSLNPVHGKVYSIQHYVIKYVSDLRVVFSNNKTEILLKVA
jgi:hypothetical protein